MNVFWKTIFGAVLTIAAIVSARYTSNWIANKTYRAERIARMEQMKIEQDRQALIAQRSFTRSPQRAPYTPPPPRHHTYSQRH